MVAGLDAVTLHGTHGYMIAEFLSPLYNQRSDEYGGSFENRMRFLRETLEKCRARVGPNFPLMVRISGLEYIRGGRCDIEETVKIAVALEEMGADAIDISASTPSAYMFTTPPYSLPEAMGSMVPVTAAIKKAVKIPVIVAIGLRDAAEAEDILETGKADLVCFGRSHIADPDFTNKALAKDYENIRPCLSCMHCLNTLNMGRGMRCAVDAETGREIEFDGAGKADSPKKVLVAGGGPAGMEAARVAALRGHTVTLVEKNDALGGSLLAAAVPFEKEAIAKLIEWYKKQLENLSVDVRLCTEYDRGLHDREKPDAVIVACGGAYARRIPGCENRNVLTAVEALLNPERVGERVVVIGGGATGSEVAEWFARRRYETTCLGASGLQTGELDFEVREVPGVVNREVSIVEMLPEICNDMDQFTKPILQFRLKQNGVRVLCHTKVAEVDESGVYVEGMADGKKEFLPADTVILAGGLLPSEVDAGAGCPIIPTGDMSRAGTIANAVYSSYIAARSL